MARQVHFFSVCTAGLVFMLCVHQTNGNFFSSLQFTRESLMKFSEGSERRVNITVSISVDVSSDYVQKELKVYPPRSSPSNKFLKVLNAIERSVANANARGIPYSAATVSRLEHLLEKAVDTKNYKYAQQVLGQIMYMLSIKPASKRRRKRDTESDAVNFLKGLRIRLGKDSFDRFMAVHGDVSLVFVVDDTGSMLDEIDAVKHIAIDIIRKRDNIVDFYILSPFNDPFIPDQLVVVEASEAENFVKAINSLTALGGADCPEHAFQGILEALSQVYTVGSPMYVFTDADPKNPTEDDIQQLLTLAEEFDVTINFLTTGSCGDGVHPAFLKLANKTSGVLTSVKDGLELEKMSALIGGELSGFNIVDHSQSRSNSGGSRGRRSNHASDSQYSIIVDDSMESIIVTVSTTRPETYGQGITLKDPGDSVIEFGKLSLSQISVYKIDNPRKGTWFLTVSGSNGEHEYYVKSSSATNIDFNHYFLTTVPGRRRRQSVEVPVSQPVIGKQNTLVITLAGSEKVDPSSLRIQLITKEGQYISDVTPQSRDKDHFTALITLSRRQDFKLKLKGYTRTGSLFQRISRQFIEPHTAVLRSRSASNDYTLPLHRTTFIHFQLCNFGNTERFDVPVPKDKMQYLTTRRVSSKLVFKNRCVTIALRVMATRLEDVNKTDTVYVTAKGRSTGTLVSATSQFLVVSGVER